jgi:hypothetical protein
MALEMLISSMISSVREIARTSSVKTEQKSGIFSVTLTSSYITAAPSPALVWIQIQKTKIYQHNIYEKQFYNI